jgi:hypothetical protein
MSNHDKYPAGTIDVRGTEIPVFVDDAGLWSCDVGETRLNADSKDGLRTRAMAETARKAVRVSIPFTRYSGNSRTPAITGTATGIHQGTGNVLVRWDSGKADQITDTRSSSYVSEGVGFYRPLSDDEVATITRLRQQLRSDQQELSEYVSPRALRHGLVHAVRDAIEAEVRGQLRQEREAEAEGS